MGESEIEGQGCDISALVETESPEGRCQGESDNIRGISEAKVLVSNPGVAGAGSCVHAAAWGFNFGLNAAASARSVEPPVLSFITKFGC